MAITKIQSESLNLADDFAFTGTITGAGESNAPAFMAELSASQTISTNTATKLACNNEIFDTHNAYNNSTYIFTCPVAGKYLFSFGARRGYFVSDRFFVELRTSSSSPNNCVIENPDSNALYGSANGSFIVNMAVNDTAYVEVYQDNGVSKDILNDVSYFGGFLIST